MILDESYNGKTLLRDWWTKVKANFKTIQDAHNTEISERKSADSVLQANLNSEVSARQSADTTLQNNINAETTARQNADTTLQNNINTETTARQNADTALDTRITAVEGTSHTHDNKTVLDGITSARMAIWDSQTSGSEEDISDIREKLTQEKHDRIVNDDVMLGQIELLLAAAHKHSNKEVIDGITAERVNSWDKISEYNDYFSDILFGFINQFRDIYTAVGFRCYSGGLFGMVYDGAQLDGGTFGDTEIRASVDGSSFGARDAHSGINSQIQQINQTLGTLSEELDTVDGGNF